MASWKRQGRHHRCWQWIGTVTGSFPVDLLLMGEGVCVCDGLIIPGCKAELSFLQSVKEPLWVGLPAPHWGKPGVF